MSLTITVISGLYQKIDPKVREARRKKFFGSGRRKRDTEEEDEDNLEEQVNLEEDLLLEVFGLKDLEEGSDSSDASRKGRADDSPPDGPYLFDTGTTKYTEYFSAKNLELNRIKANKGLDYLMLDLGLKKNLLMYVK